MFWIYFFWASCFRYLSSKYCVSIEPIKARTPVASSITIKGWTAVHEFRKICHLSKNYSVRQPSDEMSAT